MVRHVYYLLELYSRNVRMNKLLNRSLRTELAKIKNLEFNVKTAKGLGSHCHFLKKKKTLNINEAPIKKLKNKHTRD